MHIIGPRSKKQLQFQMIPFEFQQYKPSCTFFSSSFNSPAILPCLSHPSLAFSLRRRDFLFPARGGAHRKAHGGYLLRSASACLEDKSARGGGRTQRAEARCCRLVAAQRLHRAAHEARGASHSPNRAHAGHSTAHSPNCAHPQSAACPNAAKSACACAKQVGTRVARRKRGRR